MTPDEKNAEVLALFRAHGPDVAAATQTAFHAAADFHRALRRVDELVGYDAAQRARIQRYGMAAG